MAPILPPRGARAAEPVPVTMGPPTLPEGRRAPRRAPWYRPAVALYDWSYRRLQRLDHPCARIEPVLTVQRCRRWRALELADGTQLARGAKVGVLHLDNERAIALHDAGLHPATMGFVFRRLVLTSLRTLAARAADGGPLAPLQAYSVTTLFHHRLPLVGFAPAIGDGPICRPVVSLYQRALLSSLHPAGPARLRSGGRGEARRLWISRRDLLVRFAVSPEITNHLQNAI